MLTYSQEHYSVHMITIKKSSNLIFYFFYCKNFDFFLSIYIEAQNYITKKYRQESSQMLNQKPYVLIVEDKAVELNFYDFFLQKSSFNTDCYTDPKKALNAFNPDLHDIVLLDICMPIIDGFVLARQIKKKDIKKSTPIVFVSSLDKNEHIKKGIQAGGVDYIQKPVDFAELVAKMMLWIDHQKTITNSELKGTQKARKVQVQKNQIIDLQKNFRHLINQANTINQQSTTQDLYAILESLKMQLHLLKQSHLSFHAKNKIIENMEDDLSCQESVFFQKLQKFQLTNSEIKVAILIKAGLTTKEITQVLNLSVNTVETHRKKIRNKMKLRNNHLNLAEYFNLLSDYV